MSGVSNATSGGVLPPKKSCFSIVTLRPTRVVLPSLTWGAAAVRESNELNRTWNRIAWEGNEGAVEPPRLYKDLIPFDIGIHEMD